MSHDHYPRLRFARTPTPLEPMPNLTKLLGGPSLYVKRDDLTGLAFGGNKVRQLEYWFGDIAGKGADTVVTTGATVVATVLSVLSELQAVARRVTTASSAIRVRVGACVLIMVL